jgi:hypothetical protein
MERRVPLDQLALQVRKVQQEQTARMVQLAQ